MDFFSTQNILVHIPIGAGGYDLSWIEAVGTLAGLLCIWLASLEKISNYAFGLINVTLFAIIFFQIQLYASLLLQPAGGRAADSLVALAESHRLVCRLRGGHWLNDRLHQSGVCVPDPHCRFGHVRHRPERDDARTPAGCFPVLGFLHDGAVDCGDDSDDP